MQVFSPHYVLALDLELDDLQVLQNSAQHSRCAVIVARSVEQVIDQARRTSPHLVILSGDRQNWSPSFIRQLRLGLNLHNTTIVALTDRHAPRWAPEEDHPGLDGFLVKPLTDDVLTSLIESAWAKQACFYLA